MTGPDRNEFLWVAAGQTVTLLLSVATLKMLTSYLGPEAYGRFALGLAVAGTLNLFVYGPLSQAISRYVHLQPTREGSANLSRVIARSLSRSAIIIAFLGSCAALVTSAAAGRAWGTLVALALAYGIAAGHLLSWLAELNARRRRQAYAVLQSTDALLRLACGALLVMTLGADDATAMSGFLVGSLIALLLAKHHLKSNSGFGKRETLDDESALGREFASYAASISLFAVPALLSSYGDRWIIQQTLTETHVGIYVALAQIANAPANLILTVFSQSLNPVLFQRAGSSLSVGGLHASRSLLYRALLPLATLLALLTWICYAFASVIVTFMTSPEFAPHAELLWLLVLAAAVFQVGQAMAAEAFLYNRPSLLFVPKLVYAVVFLGLSLWWVADLQIGGVALAALVAALVYAPLVMITNARAAHALGVSIVTRRRTER